MKKNVGITETITVDYYEIESCIRCPHFIIKCYHCKTDNILYICGISQKVFRCKREMKEDRIFIPIPDECPLPEGEETTFTINGELVEDHEFYEGEKQSTSDECVNHPADWIDGFVTQTCMECAKLPCHIIYPLSEPGCDIVKDKLKEIEVKHDERYLPEV